MHNFLFHSTYPTTLQSGNARPRAVFNEIQSGNARPRVVKEEEKEKEEGLGVPPFGVGQVCDLTLQVLVGCAALRLLWAFRCYPSRSFAILDRRPGFATLLSGAPQQ
jgi:hypothetical protein